MAEEGSAEVTDTRECPYCKEEIKAEAINSGARLHAAGIAARPASPSSGALMSPAAGYTTVKS
jgi:hypothetical protein